MHKNTESNLDKLCPNSIRLWRYNPQCVLAFSMRCAATLQSFSPRKAVKEDMAPVCLRGV